MAGATIGDQRLAAAGLLAATLQVIAHTAARSLLFTASTGIETAGRTGELDRLRGMARRVPWSGTAAGSRPAGQVPHLGYAPDVIEVFEQYLYQPVLRPSQRSRAVRRLQSGRLDAYLAYMLVVVIAMLAVMAGLS